jgi:hypothetical protein
MELEILLCNKSGQPMLGYDAERHAVVLIPGMATPGPDGGTGPSQPVRVETGVFAPILLGTAGAADQTYARQDGYFVKLGALVWVSGAVQLSAAGTITGGLLLGGLPVDVGPGGGALAVPLFAGLVSQPGSVAGIAVPGSDKVALFGVKTDCLPLGQPDLTDDTLLTFSGWYAAP